MASGDISPATMKKFLEKVHWDKEKCNNYFDSNSGIYEKNMDTWDYRAPTISADYVQKYYGDQKDIRILDVAAGTGLAAVELQKRGFTNIDALDPSENMLTLAKEKGVYTNFIQAFLTEEPTDGIDPDQYDCVVISGGMAGGHLPCAFPLEMIRITKPGGLVINVSSDHYIYDVPDLKDRFMPFMRDLVDAGIWAEEEIAKDIFYSINLTGIVFVHRVNATGAVPKTFTSKTL